MTDLGPIIVALPAERVPVKDDRPELSRTTQIIEEYDTTTILFGDDLLSPPAPALLGQRLKHGGIPCIGSADIRLSIFLVFSASSTVKPDSSNVCDAN